MKSMDITFIKAFEARICALVPSKKELMHEAILKCVEDANAWLRTLPAPTSQLNIRMYFIEKLSEKVPTHDALQDEQILSLLLDDMGLRKVGDSVELKGEKWEVIWRRFGLNYGIEFGLRNGAGKIISDVFFD